MNILLIGSGAREHALAQQIKASDKCDQLYILPGNAGTANCGINVPISPLDFRSIQGSIKRNKISLVLVGPEEPLVKGIVNYLRKDNPYDTKIVGPEKEAALLEGSKSFAKKFMAKYGIPTAQAEVFSKDDVDKAIKYINSINLPAVIKADGLAAGKGVTICYSKESAENEVRAMLEKGKFGDASSTIVIEEYIEGIELSVFIAIDGTTYALLPLAKDYKKIGERDTGPNTGGMGAISPVPFVDKKFLQKVKQHIIEPTIEGLKKEKILYRGFLFIGLMKTKKGDPYVIEYNIRLGDPETECILPLIETDFVELLLSITTGSLNKLKLDISTKNSATVVLASEGYPYSFKTGETINGLDTIEGSTINFAGVKTEGNRYVTSSGRVLAVTSIAKSLTEALSLSKLNASRVSFPSKYFRSDIGYEFT